MILFQKIRWKNFLSTGNNFIEIDLTESSKTLIVGDNGSGKSTMVDAICFALFGRPFRNINKPTLVNTINQKNLVVEIEFSIGNRNYLIRRGIKPVVFEIYVDDVLLNQDADTKDYQKILEKSILKMTFKSFTQIVILGSASFIPFMQLKAADRRTIIEDLLDIQVFSVMNVVTKQRFMDNKTKVDELRFKNKILNENAKVIENTINSLKKTNKKRVESLENDLASYHNEIFEINSQIKDLLEINKNKDKIAKDLQVLRESHGKYIRLKTQIEHNLDQHETQHKFFENNDHCPTCQQLIESSFKKYALQDTNEKIVSFLEGIVKINKKIEEIIKKINDLESSLSSFQENDTKIRTLKVRQDYLVDSIKKIETELHDFKNADDLLVENKKRLDETRQQVYSNELEIENLLNNRQYLEVILSLLKDGGIKTKIIQQYLPIINEQINKYLSIMEFFVNFNIDENFEEQIKSRYRDIFSYENFSEGEKSRIDLALLLTWRVVARLKNSANTNLLILDEAFDGSLDNAGSEFLFQVLSTLQNTNIFVITPKRDLISDKFDRIIQFQKVKGYSRIVE